jgi:outer membrane protein assembly factor BamB
MGRIRIYNGGSGQLQFDTAGTREERNEHVVRDFNDGVLFYHDPAEGIVRCYVKLRRMAEEQFIAVYNGVPDEDPAAQLSSFKSELRAAVDGTNWSVVGDGSRDQVLFDRLATSAGTDEAVVEQVERRLDRWLDRRGGGATIDDVATLLADDQGSTGIELQVSSAERAVALLGFVRQRLTREGIVAVSRSGRTRSLRHAAVVITVDRSVDGIRLGGAAATALRRRGVDRATSDARTALESLRTGAARGEAGLDGGTTARMEQALRRAGATTRLGIDVEVGGVVPAPRVAIGTVVGLLTAGIVAFGLTLAATRPGQVASVLGNPVGILPIPGGFVLGLAVVVLGVSASVLVGPKRLRRVVSLANDGNSERAVEPAVAAIDALNELRQYASDDEEFRERVAELFDDYGLEVATRSHRVRRQQLRLGALVAGLLTVVGGGVAAALTAGSRLIATVESTWTPVVGSVTLAAVLASAAAVRRVNRDSHDGRGALASRANGRDGLRDLLMAGVDRLRGKEPDRSGVAGATDESRLRTLEAGDLDAFRRNQTPFLRLLKDDDSTVRRRAARAFVDHDVILNRSDERRVESILEEPSDDGAETDPERDRSGETRLGSGQDATVSPGGTTRRDDGADGRRTAGSPSAEASAESTGTGGDSEDGSGFDLTVGGVDEELRPEPNEPSARAETGTTGDPETDGSEDDADSGALTTDERRAEDEPDVGLLGEPTGARTDAGGTTGRTGDDRSPPESGGGNEATSEDSPERGPASERRTTGDLDPEAGGPDPAADSTDVPPSGVGNPASTTGTDAAPDTDPDSESRAGPASGSREPLFDGPSGPPENQPRGGVESTESTAHTKGSAAVEPVDAPGANERSSSDVTESGPEAPTDTGDADGADDDQTAAGREDPDPGAETVDGRRESPRVPGPNGGSDEGPHPMAHVDACNTGTNGAVGSLVAPVDVARATGDRGELAAPVVIDDRAFVGDRAGLLYGIDLASGTVDWRRETGGRVRSAPAAAGGTVYAAVARASQGDEGGAVEQHRRSGQEQGYVCAYGCPTGERHWERLLGEPVAASPIVRDGVVYVGGLGGSLFAIDAADGSVLGRVSELGEQLLSPPAVTDEAVLVAPFEGPLVRFHRDAAGVPTRTDGSTWRFRTDDGRGFVGAPAVDTDRGVVYAASLGGSLSALELSSGRTRWQLTLGSRVLTSPAVVDGGVVVVTADGTVSTIDDRGSEATTRWTRSVEVEPIDGDDGQLLASPSVGGGVVIVGGARLSGFDVDDGTRAFELGLDAPVHATPAVVDEGTVVATDEGRLAVIGRA